MAAEVYRNLQVILTANVATFEGSMLRAAKSVDAINLALKNVDRNAAASAASLNKTAASTDAAASSATKLKAVAGTLGLAIAAGLYESAKAASNFQAEMAKLNTQANAGLSIAGMKTLSSQVLNLAGSVGFSPTSLAQGLYHLESAGFRGAQALDLLGASAKVAKIGSSDLQDTTQALIAATASGIKGVQDASAAAGILNEIVGTGDMRMEQLAKAMATGVVPVFAQAGLSITDFGAAIATVTDNATPADEAATRLRMTISLMEAPSTAAQKALAAIGINATELATDMRKPDGLLVAVEDLKSHIDALADPNAGMQALIGAFGGARSGGTIQLLVDEIDRLKQKYDDLHRGDPAKVLADDWAAAQATVQVRTQQIEASFQSLAIRLGTAVLPAIGSFEASVMALGHNQGLHEYLVSLQEPLSILGQLLAEAARFGLQFGAQLAKIGLGIFAESLRLTLDLLAPFARLLDDVLRALNEHPAIIRALADAFGIYLALSLTTKAIPALYELVASLAVSDAALASIGKDAAIVGAELDASAASVSGFSALLAGLPLAVVAIGLGVLVEKMNEAGKASGKKVVANLVSHEDVSTLDGLNRSLDAANQKLADVTKSRNNLWSLGGIASALMGHGGLLDFDNQQKAISVHAKDLQDQINATNQSLYGTVAAAAAAAGGHARLVTATNLDSQAMQAYKDQVEELASDLQKFGGTAQSVFEKGFQNAQQSATAAVKTSTKDQTQALSDQTKAVKANYAAQIQQQQDAKKEIVNNTAGSRSQIDAQIADLKRKEQAELSALKTTQTTSNQSVAAVQSTTAPIHYSMAQYMADLEAQNKATEDWQRNLAKIAARGGAEMAQQLASLGPDSAALVAEAANAKSDQAFTRLRDDLDKQMQLTGGQSAMNMANMFNEMGAAGASGAAALLTMVLASFSKGPAEIGDVLTKWGNTIAAGLNPILQAAGQPILALNAQGKIPNVQGEVKGFVQQIPGGYRVVPQYARGGIENHSAEIAQPAYRLWAEPETGGEAYIPLADSKRARSTSILSQTAGIFGYDLVPHSFKHYAEGGVSGGSNLPAPPQLPPWLIAQVAQAAAQHTYAAALALENRLMAVAGIGAGAPAGATGAGAAAQAIAQPMAAARGWTGAQWTALQMLWQRESGWNPNARNASSGAFGIPQSLPASKMGPAAVSGNAQAQIAWGLGYIADRYGSPAGAWGNETKYGWYDRGGPLMPGWTSAYNGTGSPEHVLTQKMVDQLVDAVRGRGGTQIIVQAKGESTEEVARNVARKLR